MNEIENHTGVSNNVDRVEKKGSWDLYSAHYGYSKERMPMLRVLGWGQDCYVIVVANLAEKKGKVVAQCDFRDGAYGPFFTTTPDHWGHIELCRFLLRNGVGGRYKKWLKAIDDKDTALAEEYRDMAYIRFSLELTGEDEEAWSIDTTIQDPTAAEEATEPV